MPWAFAAAAVTAGATVYSASQNKKAAKDVANAELEGARMQNAAIDKQIAAIRQGIAEGDELYGNIRDVTEPGVQYLRSTIGESEQLTPAQRAELDRIRQTAINSSQVAGSALRGSGRSFVDAMREIDNDYTLRALDQNRNRADRAALQFSTPYFNSMGSQAASHATMGQQTGAAMAAQGANLADATTYGAQEKANAGLANASLYTSAVGDIFSGIKDWQKNQTRPPTQTNPAAPAPRPNDDPYGLNR